MKLPPQSVLNLKWEASADQCGLKEHQTEPYGAKDAEHGLVKHLDLLWHRLCPRNSDSAPQ